MKENSISKDYKVDQVEHVNDKGELHGNNTYSSDQATCKSTSKGLMTYTYDQTPCKIPVMMVEADQIAGNSSCISGQTTSDIIKSISPMKNDSP